MKIKSYIALTGIYFSVLILVGCVAPAPSPYGYGMPPAAYVGPIAPPAGVTVVAPIGLAPGPHWGWAYHPQLGWGWHHPLMGWRHR